MVLIPCRIGLQIGSAHLPGQLSFSFDQSGSVSQLWSSVSLLSSMNCLDSANFLLSRSAISQNWDGILQIGLHTEFLMSFNNPIPRGIVNRVNTEVGRASPDHIRAMQRQNSFLRTRLQIPQNSSPEPQIGLHSHFLMSFKKLNPGGIVD